MGSAWWHSTRILHLWCRQPKWPLVLVLADLITIQCHAYSLENYQRIGPCSHMEDHKEAPGSHLQSCSALATTAIWGVNQ